MEKVRVDRSVLVGLATLAGVALLAVAFLLGRSSGAGAPPAAPAAPSAASPRAAEPAPADAPSAEGARLPQPDPAPGAPPPPAWPAAAPLPPASGTDMPPSPAVPGPASPPAVPGSAADAPGREAVAAYFRALDAIRPSGPEGDPQNVAGSLAAALAQGDASGVDALIRETEASRTGLLAIAPPSACAAHHRETLASLDDALGMLRALKAAAVSDDPASGLAEIATRATALRSRAESLQAEERELRARFGLER